MDEIELTGRLNAARKKLQPVEKFIAVFAASLDTPIMYHSGLEHYGFRYLKPGIPHFCLLKGVRAISTLNAMVALARLGFTQEIASLVRTLVECTTYIDFVLNDFEKNGGPTEKAVSYVDSYFSDYARNDKSDFKRPQIKQKELHEVVGSTLDSLFKDPVRPASELMSNVYLTFSNTYMLDTLKSWISMEAFLAISILVECLRLRKTTRMSAILKHI